MGCLLGIVAVEFWVGVLRAGVVVVLLCVLWMSLRALLKATLRDL